MTDLFLDNKRVVLYDRTAFKFTIENVYFTKSGSYTYDLELPARENVAIFGHIDRLDTNAVETYDARLIVDNREWFVGTATITSISPESIKIQLLGGNAQMNFVNNNNLKFIDELNLGNWGEELQGAYYSGSGVGTTYSLFYSFIWVNYESMARSSREEAALWLKELLWGNKGDFVAFPIYNETSETMCNDWVQRKYDEVSFVEPRWSIPQEYSDGSTKQYGNNYPQVKFALQPYLLFIVRRIFESLGYVIDITELENNDYFRKIFIANANDRIEINKALPHWSVNEFITQIENLLGVIVVAEGKNVVIKPDYKYFAHRIVSLENIMDEWSMECEEPKNNNVGYVETDSYACLDNELRDIAKKRVVGSMEELIDELVEGGREPFIEKYKGYIIDIDNRFYVVKNGTSNLREVDYFRPLINSKDNNDIDIELKIVPCPTKDLTFDKVSTSVVKDVKIDKIEETINILSLSRADLISCSFASHSSDDIEDIDAVIMGEEDMPKEDSVDTLYIAMNDDVQDLFSLYYKYPRPFTHPIEKIAPMSADVKKTDSLSLNEASGLRTIYSEVFNKTPIIDKTRKYCISFICGEPLRTDCIYLIRNRKFVCEKFEYNIKSKGPDKIVTGYFYLYKS